jgi:hypothetical protein
VVVLPDGVPGFLLASCSSTGLALVLYPMCRQRDVHQHLCLQRATVWQQQQQYPQLKVCVIRAVCCMYLKRLRCCHWDCGTLWHGGPCCRVLVHAVNIR